MTTLTTDRLIMRMPTEACIEPYAAFYASERSAFVGGPISAELAWRGLASEIGHWSLRGYGRWMVEEKTSGAICGMVGLWFPAGWPEPEIGWSLFASAEGRGIGFEAAERARRHAYETLGWSTAISLVDPANARSIALAERLGAVRDGDFAHERYGAMGVWRHPSPNALGMEAG